MKLIIAGSRHFDQPEAVKKFITSATRDLIGIFEKEITEVVSGCARGIDTIGEEWAQERGIPVKRFPADWDTHGKRAGPIRNAQMADYGDALLAIWDGKSRGTANMIQMAKRRGLTVMELEIELPDKRPKEGHENG